MGGCAQWCEDHCIVHWLDFSAAAGEVRVKLMEVGSEARSLRVRGCEVERRADWESEVGGSGVESVRWEVRRERRAVRALMVEVVRW